MVGRERMNSPMALWWTMTREVKDMKDRPEGEGDLGSCGLASAGGTLPGRPAQNRTNEPGRLFSFHRAFFMSGPDPLQTAARGNGRLEALPKVLANAALLLGLDDAVLVSRHALFGNPEAGRRILRHLHLSRETESGTIGDWKAAGLFDDLQHHALLQLG